MKVHVTYTDLYNSVMDMMEEAGLNLADYGQSWGEIADRPEIPPDIAMKLREAERVFQVDLKGEVH